MSMLQRAVAMTDNRDLVVMTIVEHLRHQNTPATAAKVATYIGGASAVRVAPVLARLDELVRVLDRRGMGYEVNPMGAELLSQEVRGWIPSLHEQARRDAALRSAAVGRMRS